MLASSWCVQVLTWSWNAETYGGFGGTVHFLHASSNWEGAMAHWICKGFVEIYNDFVEILTTYLWWYTRVITSLWLPGNRNWWQQTWGLQEGAVQYMWNNRRLNWYEGRDLWISYAWTDLCWSFCMPYLYCKGIYLALEEAVLCCLQGAHMCSKMYELCVVEFIGR